MKPFIKLVLINKGSSASTNNTSVTSTTSSGYSSVDIIDCEIQNIIIDLAPGVLINLIEINNNPEY